MKLLKTLTLMFLLFNVEIFSIKANDEFKSVKPLGQVKQITTVEYDMDKSTNSLIKKTEFISAYDTYGNILREDLKNASDKPIRSTRNKYNTSSKIIDYTIYSDEGVVDTRTIGELRSSDNTEISVKNYDSTGALTSKIETLFNTDGKISTVTQFDVNAKPLTKKEYYYQNGNLDYIRLTDARFSDSAFNDIIESFDYDKNNNVILAKRMTADGKMLSLTEKFYNTTGKLTKEVTYPSLDISNSEKIVKTFDQFGNTLEILYYDCDNNKIRKEYFARMNNGVLKDYAVYQDSNGKLVPDFTQSFDRYGNETKRAFYNVNGELEELITIDYKLDSQDNWIEKIEHNNQAVDLVTKREIVYF